MIPIPSHCYSFLSGNRYHEKEQEQEQEQRSSPTAKLRRPQENGGGWWCSEWPADQAVPDHLWPVRDIQSGPNPCPTSKRWCFAPGSNRWGSRGAWRDMLSWLWIRPAVPATVEWHQGC